MDESQLSRYHTKRLIEEIQSKRGRGTELISVYIPPERKIHEVQAYLRNEQSESSNIKSKSTRKNVTGALESIMSRLRTFKNPPPNGLALFTGAVSVGGDQTQMVSYVLEPPQPVPTFIYRCDSTFYLDPILEMMSEKDVYGLIVIDRSEGTIGLLKGTRVEELKNIQSLVPSKHGKGGQSARRFERLIEIAAHEYFVKFGTLVNEMFLPIENLKGILIGGPGATKDFFASKEYLHHELRKKIIGTFDTGYTNEYGLRELVGNAREKLDELGLMEEKKLIQRFLQELRKPDGGLSVYGQKETLAALEMGAVDVLMVSDNLNTKRVHIVCESCGNDETISVRDGESVNRCPKCNSPVNPEVEDLIDQFYSIAEQFNTDVELISGDSEEGELLMKAFGGMAGLLRYKI